MSGDVAVLGASGFIGSHLVERLAAGGAHVRCLSRKPGASARPNVQWFEGSVLDDAALDRFLPPGGFVVNLAYAGGLSPERHSESARRIVARCRERGVTHIVHCSTAAVAGATVAETVDETTPCAPVTSYEREKFAIEEVFRETAADMRVTILRPTAVFGDGGLGLVSMLRLLSATFRAKAWARSFLFGKRSLNLVPVATVVNAIEACIARPDSLPATVLLVSADDEPLNNYRDVETVILSTTGRPFSVSPPLLPRAAVTSALSLLRKAHGQPFRRFVSRYPGWANSIRSEPLEDAVAAYVKSGSWR